ncbi:MAG: ROK family protein [Verrucomicrobiae bacterium]|jgi:hypothetical protein|nr:ROK family protein [Verrucomicrobiae bacterium]
MKLRLTVKKATKHSTYYNFSSTLLWGINISDTKIEGLIVDANEPAKPLIFSNLAVDSFCAYDRLRGYEYTLGQIELLVEHLEKASNIPRPEKIGIAVPAVIDPLTGILSYCNNLCFNDRPLKDDLSLLLKTEIILANDANCFALAEATLGLVSKEQVVMGLILETGVGSGIVIGKRIVQGLHGIAGEWGHNTMQNETTPCCCGKQGCNETIFSKPALEQFYEKITGEEVSLQEILRRAEKKDSAALRTLEHLQDTFAKAIAVAINLLDPNVIFIGGNLRTINLLYEEKTRFKISQNIFNKKLKTPILPSLLGESAIVVGASLLCHDFS